MKKNVLKVFCLFMMIITFTCCGVETSNSSSNLTKDRAGNDITIPSKIDKIITISPSITETLVDLGLSDKIIGIDTYSTGIEGLNADLPTFDIMAPDTEKLIALKPDIVFITSMSEVNGVNPFKPLIDVGICVACIPTSDSIQSIKEDIEFLGKVIKQEDKSKVIIKNMEDEIDKIKKIGDTILEKKKVYFEIASAPYMYSFGKNVYLNEMIEMIGATNVLSDQESWISVSEEIILNSNPDVILTNVNYIDNPIEEIKARNGWENISAVKNNQVYYIDNDASSHSNEFIIKALKEMAKGIYPDKYSD